MWRAVTIEARIDHPPDRVFAYLADPTRWPEFAPAVESRRQLDAGPAEVGTRWAAVDRIGPFAVRFTDELLEQAPRRVVWRSTDPWNSRVEYVCEDQLGGTLVHARYEGDVGGWLRLIALLPTFVLERILQRDFTGLRQVLAAEEPREERSGSDLFPAGSLET